MMLSFLFRAFLADALGLTFRALETLPTRAGSKDLHNVSSKEGGFWT